MKVGPKCKDWYSQKEGTIRRHSYLGKKPYEDEAERGVTPLYTKEHQGLLLVTSRSWKKKGGILLLQPSEGTWCC